MKEKLKTIWDDVSQDTMVMAAIGGLLIAVLAAALKSATEVFKE